MKKLYAISATYADDLRKLEELHLDALTKPEVYMGFLDDEEDGEDDKPYQVIGGTALYSIKGKMMTSGDWYTRWRRIPTYDALSDDLARILQDGEVERVLISMDTPGGHLAGISDLSETWRMVNKEKPITVHVAGNLGSGGVWLAMNSTKVYASETAEVGSIGVVMQHMSYEKALEKEGVKVTTFRSAPLKYVGDQTRDLTPEEKAYFDQKVAEGADLFQKHLMRVRPKISSEAFSGAMFSATEAQRLGLVDAVMSYTKVFEKLSASADSNRQPSYAGGMQMKRKVTAAMAEAAVLAGADPNLLEVVSQEVYDALPETEKQTLAPDKAGDQSASQDQNGATVESLIADLALVATESEELKTQLAAATAQVETLTTENTSLQSQLTAMAGDPLRKIAEERISVMRTAFALTPMDFSRFSTETLLAEYNALDAQFKKSFRPGGIVPQKNEEQTPAASAKITSIDTARLRATV